MCSPARPAITAASSVRLPMPGYKMIIILAGLHNNLRSQTQVRLDEGFLGYETALDGAALWSIGVGEIRCRSRDTSELRNQPRRERATSGATVARHLGVTPEQRPWLFVVKKNKTVLDRLLALDHASRRERARPGDRQGHRHQSARCSSSMTRPITPASIPESRCSTKTASRTRSTSRQPSTA